MTNEHAPKKTKSLNGKIVELGQTPLGLIVIYFCSSVLLSALIFVRFNLLFSVWIVRFNILVYFFTYYVVAALLPLIWLFLRFHSKENERITNKKLLLVSLATFACFTGIVLISIFGKLPEYWILAIPIASLLLFYLIGWKPARRSRRIVAVVLFLCSLLLPIGTTFFSFNQVLSNAYGMNNQEDQVKYISDITLATISQLNLARANSDFQKLLLSGDGACGEGAIAMLTYLKELGFDVRETGFPGEDHAFIEVKLNDTWLVVDPGYGLLLASRTTRADRRVQEAGTISYVAAYAENGFIELTPKYVETDKVVIRITLNGEPLSGVSLTLVHTLVTDGNSRTMSLPGHGFSFHTDINGTSTINLGRIGESIYMNSFTKTDPFYFVYVDGKNTNLKISSNGMGMLMEYQIDLATL